MSIAVIKLVNGTEIVGNVLGEGSTVTVEDPLQINYRQKTNGGLPSVSLHRFNPFSLNNVYTFLTNEVLSVDPPVPGMVKYYEVSIKTIRSQVDSLINEELLDAAAQYGDYTEDQEIRLAMEEKNHYNPTIN